MLGIEEPDIDAIHENFWELYLNSCAQTNTKATIKDFLVWLEDKDYV